MNLPVNSEETQIDYDLILEEEAPFARRLAEWIWFYFHPNFVLDVGAGPGVYVDALRKFNVCAYGIEPDPRAQQYCKFLRQCTLAGCASQISEPGVSVILCLEVLEHVNPADSDQFFKDLYNVADQGTALIMSVAQPGQGGVGHINTMPREDVRKNLQAVGFVLADEVTAKLVADMRVGYHMGWFLQNVIVAV